MRKKEKNWLILTPEYPPVIGGVSDYSRIVSQALSQDGTQVTVLSSGYAKTFSDGKVTVKCCLGAFLPWDLFGAGSKALKNQKGSIIFLQWVPHGFGLKSINVFFVFWLLFFIARKRHPLILMIHEPFLRFKPDIKIIIASLIQRAMLFSLIAFSSRLFLGNPTWAKYIRRINPANKPMQNLPIPSNIPASYLESSPIRKTEDGTKTIFTICHFSTYGRQIESELQKIIVDLFSKFTNVRILLVGKGSEHFHEKMSTRHPFFSGKMESTGPVDHSTISGLLSQSDIAIHPLQEGISFRNTTVAAYLAHGVPIVGTLGEATDKLFIESNLSILVPPGNVSQFVNAVGLLLENPAERIQMSTRGLEFYSRHLDIKNTVSTLAAL
jgi:glycosyltransferase involved in cell wall biosynthesis